MAGMLVLTASTASPAAATALLSVALSAPSIPRLTASAACAGDGRGGSEAPAGPTAASASPGALPSVLPTPAAAVPSRGEEEEAETTSAGTVLANMGCCATVSAAVPRTGTTATSGVPGTGATPASPPTPMVAAGGAVVVVEVEGAAPGPAPAPAPYDVPRKGEAVVVVGGGGGGAMAAWGGVVPKEVGAASVVEGASCPRISCCIGVGGFSGFPFPDPLPWPGMLAAAGRR